MFDTSHPMFRPLWVRLLICATLFIWTGVEWVVGSQTWMVIVGAMGLISVYKLLIEYRAPAEDNPTDTPDA